MKFEELQQHVQAIELLLGKYATQFGTSLETPEDLLVKDTERTIGEHFASIIKSADRIFDPEITDEKFGDIEHTEDALQRTVNVPGLGFVGFHYSKDKDLNDPSFFLAANYEPTDRRAFDEVFNDSYFSDGLVWVCGLSPESIRNNAGVAYSLQKDAETMAVLESVLFGQ